MNISCIVQLATGSSSLASFLGSFPSKMGAGRSLVTIAREKAVNFQRIISVGNIVAAQSPSLFVLKPTAVVVISTKVNSELRL